MGTVREIEQAVKHLTEKDLARFRVWFEEFDAQIWDKQFEKDAKTGKFDKFAEQAIADFRAGRYDET